MYRSDPSLRERSATVAFVVLVHVALAYVLINLSGVARLPGHDVITRLIDITPDPPPPIVEVLPDTPKPKEKEAAASAPNIKSKATEVAVPKPKIPVKSPNPVVATETPRQGTQSTQGASTVAGPGTGAGGVGNGDGSGGAGNGNGGGGEGLAMIRARLATRTLDRRDFSGGLLDRWPPDRQIFMRLRVDAEGKVIQCIVDIGSGDPGVDSTVCATAQARLRFTPGVNREGRRVADWFGYRQRPLQ